jgi:hypothetical protein
MNDFNIFLRVEENGTSEVLDISSNAKVFFDLGQVCGTGIISRKRADLYLFRHPEIQTIKNKNKKFVLAAPFLSYLLRSAQRRGRRR